MTQRIAVIGAGMAGLTCASQLAARGCDVQVFDKGRTIGGRLATREWDGLAFDHGAPFVIAERGAFGQFMAHLRASGHAADWQLGTSDGFVGLPAMNRMLAPIAEGLAIEQLAEVTALVHGGDSWTLGLHARVPQTGYDAVVVAVPAPQAAALLKASAEWIAAQLGAVQYAPVLTAMAAFEGASGVGEAVLTSPSADIALAIRNDAKPERPAQCEQWVIHASSEWSRAHLEWERPQIGAALIEAFCAAIARPDLRPAYQAGHRWRYARVSQPLGVSHLYDPLRKLGLCGDYCRGANAEHAFESGMMLAQAMG